LTTSSKETPRPPRLIASAILATIPGVFLVGLPSERRPLLDRLPLSCVPG
jgi:hypothetical protein